MGLGTEAFGGMYYFTCNMPLFSPLNRGRRQKVVIFVFKFSAYKVEKEGTVTLGTWLRKCQKNEVILQAISKKIWVCGFFPVVFQWLKG